MKRLMLMLTVAAIMTAMTAASALPAQAKTCHVLDTIDWWVITGEISEYGGMYCH